MKKIKYETYFLNIFLRLHLYIKDYYLDNLFIKKLQKKEYIKFNYFYVNKKIKKVLKNPIFLKKLKSFV